MHVTVTDISGHLLEGFFTREKHATLNKESKGPGMYFISAFDEQEIKLHLESLS
jgi:hypothetical protein